jgi:hypothetical protein
MDAPVPVFREHDKLFHKFNPDLGPGRVEQVDGRRIVVWFPAADTRLTLAADDNALRAMPLRAGQKARLEGEEEPVVLDEVGAETTRLADGRVVTSTLLWPLAAPDDPVDRLGALQTDRAASFRNRLDGLLLAEVRQARGLGSFLGGRIAIFPHQLHVAERATASDPVRWLLADEVGLGKTIEACLILSRLLRGDRADRALVVAPATLTVQWLGELYRKFHQTFVLLDRRRREDVAKEHGEGFNPFEAHRRAIVSLEDLTEEPGLAQKAEAAGFDLLVVDEAHRLERARGEAGSEAYLAVAPLTRAAKHVLLLSATPLEADAHGFFRLLELLRPDAYTSEEAFLSSIEAGIPLPPCTSATRRVDIGGLQPRIPRPVDLGAAPAAEGLTGDDAADAEDPRVAWIASQDAGWRADGSAKTLVFVHERATLSALKARIESATRKRVAIFHEELTPERGDVEVAEFRRADGPSILISTEAGGEGRNFEFCRRLVLFDLPADPAAVEQRIGRLDRINRTSPVEIVYFRPPGGFGRELATLYERIGLFTSPLGGLERSLSDVEAAICPRPQAREAPAGRGARGAGVARRRGAPESRLPPPPPRRLRARDRARDPRPRPGGPRRAHGAVRPRGGGPLRLRDRRARGPQDVVPRVRLRLSRRAPAGRLRRLPLAGDVRPRRGRREGGPRLLRVGTRARRGDLPRARGRAPRARRAPLAREVGRLLRGPPLRVPARDGPRVRRGVARRTRAAGVGRPDRRAVGPRRAGSGPRTGRRSSRGRRARAGRRTGPASSAASPRRSSPRAPAGSSRPWPRSV